MDGLLSINPGLTVWTIVSFVIFFALLSKFAWGPIMSSLEKREANIRESIEQAERAKEEAEKILAEHKAALQGAREETRQMIADAKAIGEEERAKIVAKAQSEGASLLERAKNEIRGEEAAAIQRVREEAVDLALGAAGKLLERSLNEGDHRNMVEDFIKQVSAGKKS